MTDEQLHVGTDYRPGTLELAVRWTQGWKTYDVTGTRHAYYLLRKLVQYRGFERARLNAPLVTSDGYLRPNVISFDEDDIIGSDRFGKFHALMDRNNAYFDLSE